MLLGFHWAPSFHGGSVVGFFPRRQIQRGSSQRTEALPPDPVSDSRQQRQQPQREARPPILGWPPLTFPNGARIGTYDEVIALRNGLRQQRRSMRRRGLRPDAHLPRGFRLNPTTWDRAGRRYSSWLEGAQLSEQDVEGLNDFLRVVLAPVTIHGPHMGVLSANEEGGGDSGGDLRDCALQHVVEARRAALCGHEGGPMLCQVDAIAIFDVRDPLAVRGVALRELGWPEGRAPTWGQLVTHIIDCLEFGLAMCPAEASVTLLHAEDDAGDDVREFDDFDEGTTAADGSDGAAVAGDVDDEMACAADPWEMGSDSGSESDAEA